MGYENGRVIKMTWNKREYEVTDDPEEGELVQFVAVHVLRMKDYGITHDDAAFFLREPVEED